MDLFQDELKVQTSKSKKTYLRDRLITFDFKCTRNNQHNIYALFIIKNNILQKVGQFPSVADLSFKSIEKYKKILGSDGFKEFNKSIGLVSHGIGIGSFVYLRRIIEQLIEKYHLLAKSSSADWDENKYLKSRFDEKIISLKDYLPKFIIENKILYSILSKGIHELTENECLEFYQIVKLGIELILDDELEKVQKEEKIKKAEKSIQGIYQKLSKEV